MVFIDIICFSSNGKGQNNASERNAHFSNIIKDTHNFSGSMANLLNWLCHFFDIVLRIRLEMVGGALGRMEVKGTWYLCESVVVTMFG